MRRYRLVFLDGEGRPQAYDCVYCASDAEAAREARASGYRHEIEVWEGDSLVRRLNSRSLLAESAASRRSPMLA
jgi:hypothetical protein